jgi:hypothetical protein
LEVQSWKFKVGSSKLEVRRSLLPSKVRRSLLPFLPLLTRSRLTASRPSGTSLSLLTRSRLTASRPSGTSLSLLSKRLTSLQPFCPNGLQAFSRFVQTAYKPSAVFTIDSGAPPAPSALRATSLSLVSKRPTSLQPFSLFTLHSSLFLLHPSPFTLHPSHACISSRR